MATSNMIKKEREYILGVIRKQRLVIRKFMPCRVDILCKAILLHTISQSLKMQERAQLKKLAKEFLLELFFCLSLLFFIYSLSIIYLYSRDSTFRIRDIYRDSMPLYFTFYGMSLLAILTMLYLYYCRDWYSKEKLEHLHFLDELEYTIQKMSDKQASQLIDSIKARSIWASIILKIKFT